MDIHLSYSTTLIFFLTVLQSCRGFMCPKPMGNFPMIQSESCEVFWKCRGGRAIAEQCKPGEQYDYMKGMCLPQKFVACIMQRKMFIQAMSRPKPAPMQQPQKQQSRPIILYPVPLRRPTKRPTPAPTPAPTQAPTTPPQQWPQPFPFPPPPCGAPPQPPCGGPPGPCGAPPAPPCGAPAPGPCGAPPNPPCGGAPGPFGPLPPAPINSFGGPQGFFSFSQNGFQNGLPPLAQRILRRVLG